MLVVGDRVRYRFQCTRDGTNPSNPLFADALQPDAGGLFLCTLLWHSEIAFTLLVNCFPQSGTMLIRFSSEKVRQNLQPAESACSEVRIGKGEAHPSAAR